MVSWRGCFGPIYATVEFQSIEVGDNVTYTRYDVVKANCFNPTVEQEFSAESIFDCAQQTYTESMYYYFNDKNIQ